MLTDRETELRDAYLKGYEDRINYSDKLVVDRYELAERYAVNQAQNNEVLDLVMHCSMCTGTNLVDCGSDEYECADCGHFPITA